MGEGSSSCFSTRSFDRLFRVLRGKATWVWSWVLSSLKSISQTKRDGDGKGRGGSSHQLRSWPKESFVDRFFVLVMGEGTRSNDPERKRRFMGDLKLQMMDRDGRIEVYYLGNYAIVSITSDRPRFSASWPLTLPTQSCWLTFLLKIVTDSLLQDPPVSRLPDHCHPQSCWPVFCEISDFLINLC